MKKKLKPLTEQEILRRNPSVSKDLVERFKELEIKLHELGVDTKTRFTISPPLGGSHLLLSNR